MPINPRSWRQRHGHTISEAFLARGKQHQQLGNYVQAIKDFDHAWEESVCGTEAHKCLINATLELNHIFTVASRTVSCPRMSTQEARALLATSKIKAGYHVVFHGRLLDSFEHSAFGFWRAKCFAGAIANDPDKRYRLCQLWDIDYQYVPVHIYALGDEARAVMCIDPQIHLPFDMPEGEEQGDGPSAVELIEGMALRLHLMKTAAPHDSTSIIGAVPFPSLNDSQVTLLVRAAAASIPPDIERNTLRVGLKTKPCPCQPSVELDYHAEPLCDVYWVYGADPYSV